ncbi:hypothetical protein Hanom_Chr06g00536411 [Helianthus anomalus]
MSSFPFPFTSLSSALTYSLCVDQTAPPTPLLDLLHPGSLYRLSLCYLQSFLHRLHHALAEELVVGLKIAVALKKN